MNYKTVKKENFNLHLINTDKFKTIRISVKMQRPLKREEATIRSLISLLFMNGTKDFSSQKEFSRELEMLYGSNISTSITKKGLASILTLAMSMPNEAYIDEPILERGIKLLSDILLNPSPLTNEIVTREKRQLKERLESVYDNKMRYSLRRLIEIMGKDEPFSISVDGYLDEIEPITIEQINTYIKSIIANDVFDIFVVGNIIENEIEELLSKYFNFDNNSNRFDVLLSETKSPSKQVIDEIQELNQGKLNIGYRTNINLEDEQYYAMYLANGILGAFPHSKLFLNVREKASLAYYAASSYDSYNGLILVYSGIESKNYDQAVDIIRKQIQEIKQGNISEEEISQTKAMIINGMYESFDASGGIIDFYFTNILTGIDEDLDTYIGNINKVTKEQIMKAAQNIDEDCIYFLHGGKK